MSRDEIPLAVAGVRRCRPVPSFSVGLGYLRLFHSIAASRSEGRNIAA